MNFSNMQMTPDENKFSPTFVSNLEFHDPSPRGTFEHFGRGTTLPNRPWEEQKVVFIRSNKKRPVPKKPIIVVTATGRIRRECDIPPNIVKELKQWKATFVRKAIQKEQYPNRAAILKLLARANLAYILKKKFVNSAFREIRKGIQNKKIQIINKSLQHVQFL